MMVGAERGDIDGMVLWDPVVSGKAYIKELTTRHQAMLRYAHVKSKRRITGEKPTEILGFPVTDFLVTDLENTDLLAIRERPANNILVIEGNEDAGLGRLREHLKSIDANVEYQHSPSPQLWNFTENFGKVLVPHQILLSVVSWISEVYP